MTLQLSFEVTPKRKVGDSKSFKRARKEPVPSGIGSFFLPPLGRIPLAYSARNMWLCMKRTPPQYPASLQSQASEFLQARQRPARKRRFYFVKNRINKGIMSSWLPLTRELSAKLTEGEIFSFHTFSPSVFCYAKSTSLVRGRHYFLLIAISRKSAFC